MLILMRGWPGSGKTTLAKQLTEWFYSTTIYSTDDFFVRDDGEYDFAPSHIAEAHQWNIVRTRQWFEEHHDGDVLIIDNTNILNEHLLLYQDLAKKNEHTSYQSVVPEVTMVNELFASGKVEEAMIFLLTHWRRNIHGVPLSTIVFMFEQWEDSVLPFLKQEDCKVENKIKTPRFINYRPS